jgi:hypothetical protein
MELWKSEVLLLGIVASTRRLCAASCPESHNITCFRVHAVVLCLATNVFVFIVTRSEIRSIQAARNNPRSTLSRNLL